MPRSCSLIFASVLLASSLSADDSALWREFGLVHSSTAQQGALTVSTYQMKDQTGALAAWQWLRSAKSHTCDLASFCTQDPDRTVIFDDNYVFVFEGGIPSKADLDATLVHLPNRRDSSLPAVLTFLPREGRLGNSARYVLGPISLIAFAPELAGTHPGFEQGAEAETAAFKVPQSPTPVRLAIFYYATPEMARLHLPGFRSVQNVRAKRSGVLIAAVFGPASDAAAEALLNRVEYEAKITWNEIPPPSPIKPLFQLLINILYLSGLLSAICLAAGIIYGGMRIYRRRYGTLEADEAMITLKLVGD